MYRFNGLMGEQLNPWNVLPLQGAMSRHRGTNELTVTVLGGDRPSQTAQLKL